MPDPNSRERAALRLVEGLTPAFALGIECPWCGSIAAVNCVDSSGNGKAKNEHWPEYLPVTHTKRREAARAELHSLLLTLGLGVSTPEQFTPTRDRLCPGCYVSPDGERTCQREPSHNCESVDRR